MFPGLVEDVERPKSEKVPEDNLENEIDETPCLKMDLILTKDELISNKFILPGSNTGKHCQLRIYNSFNQDLLESKVKQLSQVDLHKKIFSK